MSLKAENRDYIYEIVNAAMISNHTDNKTEQQNMHLIIDKQVAERY